MNKTALTMTFLGILALLPLSGFGETGWVVNSEENTVALFGTSSHDQLSGSPIVVGLGPIDIVGVHKHYGYPQPGTSKIYVANYSGNSITVIDREAKSVIETHTGSPGYGSISQPTALALAYDSLAGLPQLVTVYTTIAFVDRKDLDTKGGTIRFIDPSTESIADEWEIGIADFDPVDIAFTPANSAFWVTGKGTDQVLRVVFAGAGPPFDTDPAPSLTEISHASIVDPARIATTSDYVFVTNSGSDYVTVLDDNGVVQTAVDVGSPQIDAVIIGDNLYVSTTENKIKVLATTSPFAVSDTILGFGGDIGCVGESPDGALFVGSGSGEGDIYAVDIDAIPPTIVSFTFSQDRPFEFFIPDTANEPPDEITVSGGGGNGSCYIAGAAYGNPRAAEALSLVRFRDRYLSTDAPGKSFCALYATLAPPVADALKEADGPRSVVRFLLSLALAPSRHFFVIVALAFIILIGYTATARLRSAAK